ncbi:MAG: septum formation protein Maf [Deltaproteobacteria bacterium]|nr:septum formation protein Maf [Deltaproteobacteria bacterium]
MSCDDGSSSSLILASASPRRRELLAASGLTFEVCPSQVPEVQLPDESPEAFVRRLAAAKAREVATSYRARGDLRPVLGADTVVVIDGTTLGKAATVEEAREMLATLSGRVHRVVTGVCVLSATGTEEVQAVATEVEFKTLTAREIATYLRTDDWQDKAGAYAIQDRAAYMVRTIRGSYTNVVGLPLCEALEALGRAGVGALAAG